MHENTAATRGLQPVSKVYMGITVSICCTVYRRGGAPLESCVEGGGGGGGDIPLVPPPLTVFNC